MTWTITLPRLGKNRKFYTGKIKDLNAELVEKDDQLKNILATSNCSFQDFVASIRKVVEDAYPNNNSRPQHAKKLLSNTNWANHGAKNTKYPSTTVTVEHCDDMVDRFQDLLDNYKVDSENDEDEESDVDEADGSGGDAAVNSLVASLATTALTVCSVKECTNTFTLPPSFRGKQPKCRECRS